MSEREDGGFNRLMIIGAVIIFIIIALSIFSVTPAGKTFFRDWDTSLKEVDEGSYENQKLVEDTARSMISSYKTDVSTYNTYKDSIDEEEQSWAKQAKIRANKTAYEYSEYVLKNQHVWAENVPDDIAVTLDILE